MRAEGFVPHAAKVTAALSAAATITKPIEDHSHSHGCASPKENQVYSQLLFGRGFGGGASLREAASPGTLAQSKVTAALSAAATTTPKQENAPTLHGREPSKEESSLFASRSSGEGVWGRGASLREAASPPESPPPYIFSGGSAREGPFLQKRPLPRITNILLILSRVVQQTTGEDHAALAGSEGKENGVVVPLGLVAERQALFASGNGGANIGQG